MAKERRIGFLFLVSALTAVWPSIVSAQAQEAPAVSHLGKVSFQTSCSAETQALLDKGLALLHSFQYMEAKETFDSAEARDAKCAMAHWGKAMSIYQQLWTFPTEKQLKEGRDEIKTAEKLHPQTVQEKGFVNAAAVFYQEDSKLSHVDRIKAYSAELEKLRQQTPEDVEAGAFAALALVSLAENEVDSLANQEKAIAILNPLFEKYPDHPGVAHYFIHAADRPELAEQGLAAARRYAAIAPDSAHALHMPSHIFVRLGLWQDSITSNIASKAAAAHAAEEHKAEAHYQTHAMDYLNYSYLQVGQEGKARDVIAQMDHVVGGNEEIKAWRGSWLRARTALDLHRWAEAKDLTVPNVPKDEQDNTYWAKAIGAARSGDAAAAEEDVKQLAKSVEEREAKMRKRADAVPAEKATDLREAEAWLAYAQGKSEDALAELRAAVAREESNGGESVIIPAREMLADMLSDMKRSGEALAEYRIVLKNAPNRFDALLGAGKMAEATGEEAEAREYFSNLTEMCAGEGDRPELAQVRAILARK